MITLAFAQASFWRFSYKITGGRRFEEYTDADFRIFASITPTQTVIFYYFVVVITI
jgi:hypothetical protein